MALDASQLGLGLIGWREVKDLTLHPATSLVPAAPGAGDVDQPPDVAPLHIVADGRILVGREQYERARAVGQGHLATVVVTVPDDKIELYVLDQALAAQYLTDDQRACLAVEYADRLSARMKRERARTAAAARHGHAPYRPTGAAKQDSRAEACKKFRIPTKKFRQVHKLRKQSFEQYRRVLHGEFGVKAAWDWVATERVATAEAARKAAGPIGRVDELLHGDAVQVLPELPDGHFTALITDPPYGVNFRQDWRGSTAVAVAGDRDAAEAVDLFRRVLTAAGPKLRPDAFLLTFVPATHEPAFRDVVVSLGWRIIAYPIWTKNTGVPFNTKVASRHERLLLAVRGTAELRRQISDVFTHGKTHASKHPCEKPVDLLEEFVEALTVEGEAVLDPFTGTGSTVVAAKRTGRQAVGIEVDARWYSDARERLQHEFPAASGDGRTSPKTTSRKRG